MNKSLIHPSALISKKCKIGNNVLIGPYCIIENDVKIGDNTTIDSHTIVKKHTTIGSGCNIFSHSVIGEIPQDKKYAGEKTKLIIGDNTVIREFCTVNRGTEETKLTKIGNNCLLMAYVHIGHDCIINNNVIDAGKILVTGGGGLVGSCVTGNHKPRSIDLDLMNFDAINSYIRDNKIEYVVHCAAMVGGVKENTERLGEFFYNNMQMNLNMVKQ